MLFCEDVIRRTLKQRCQESQSISPEACLFNVRNNFKKKAMMKMMNRTRLIGSIAIDNRENNILILFNNTYFCSALDTGTYL